MVDAKALPRLTTLRKLATQIKDFPISGLGVVEYAEHTGYDDETVDFLKLFAKQRIFDSRGEFIYYCNLLEQLLKEEVKSPYEWLRSPQE